MRLSFAYVDKEALLDKPKLWLCRPNKKRTDKLTDVYGVSIATKENALNELSFTIPVEVERNHELVPNPLLDKLKGHYLVEVLSDNKTEYFIITSDSGTLSNDGVEKSFTLYSYAHKLAKKFIRQYEGVSQNLTKFATDFLSETSWSVGSVDAEFDLKYRSFDVSTSSVLQCLFDIAEKFGAMIEFDTVTKRVNFYKVERGMNRGLRFKEGFYLESFDVQYDYDTIVTRLKAYGYDGLEFRSLSPTASNYIENFEWFMYPFDYIYNSQTNTYTVTSKSNYMSDDLCLALVKYNKLLDDNKTTFNNLVTQKTTKQSELTTLNTQLNTLNNDLKILENELDTINSTYGDSATSRTDYKTCITNINNKKTEIANKESEINTKESEIANIDTQISNLNSTLAIEKNFTSDELLELDEFIIEGEYSNDSITEEQDLLDEALSALEEVSTPTITLSIGLANFLNSLENDVNRKKLILGDTVRFKSEKLKVELVARISEINRDYENGNVSLTITNAREAKDEDTRIYKMIYGSASTSNTVNMDKFKWNQAVTQSDDVSKILNNTLDATLHGIKGGVNSTITFNERGMFSNDIAEPNNVLVINGGRLAISGDSLQSISTAIDKTGVWADRLVGRLLLGNKLHIEDDLGIVKIESGTVTTFDNVGTKEVELGKYTLDGVTKYGLNVIGGAFDIRSSTTANRGIQIDSNGIRAFNTNGVETFTVDSASGKITTTGSFEFKTTSTSSRGIKFSNTGIEGFNSSGTRTFYLDTNGNLTANSGTFTGVINATGGRISGDMEVDGTLSGGRIEGSEIDGVDITGSTITGGSIKSNTQIEVSTDITIGNNIYMTGQSSYGDRNIYFTGTSTNSFIRYTDSSGRIAIASSIFEISGDTYMQGFTTFSNDVDFNDRVSFYNTVDFSSANVIGLTVDEADTVGGFSFGYSSSTNRLYVTRNGTSIGFVELTET